MNKMQNINENMVSWVFLGREKHGLAFHFECFNSPFYWLV